MKDALKKRKVTEVEGSEKITIRSKSVREPSFSPQPRFRQPRYGAAGKQGLSGRRSHSEAARRRRWRRWRTGERRWRGPGRFRLHAFEGRIPRAVLRGPEASQPDQDAHQGSEDAGAAARRLYDRRSAGQAQSRAHDAPLASRAGSRCAGPRTQTSCFSKKMLAEAESDTPRDDVRDRGAQGAARAGCSGCVVRSPTSIRSTFSTTAPSACRGRRRRR